MNRNRIDYTKNSRLIPAIYYDERPINAVTFIEYRDVNIDGIKKDAYYVDNIGNVYSKRTRTIMSPKIINSGYHMVSLSTESGNPRYRNILIHRLMMMVWNPIENYESFTVNHINMCPFDNSIDNLEWMSQSQNNIEKYKVFPNDGENNYRSMFSFDQVKIILDGFDMGLRYSDILGMIGIEDTKVNRDYIGNIKRGVTYKREVEEILREKLND